MIEYEKQFSIYLVKQILILFDKLCFDHSDIPSYKITCNFENKFSEFQYIFENYSYKTSNNGLKIRGDYICLEDYENREITQMADLCQDHELVIKNDFNNNRFCIILDIEHKRYETNFFKYVVESYIETKKYNIEKLLDTPNDYKDVKKFVCGNNKYSIFEELGCDFEEEFLLSRAVSNFFFYCYGIDINLITMLSCQLYEGMSNTCSIYIPRRWTGRGKKLKGLNIRLRVPIEFTYAEIRRIRKFMEMAKDGLNLVLNREKSIIGYTDLPPNKYEGKITIEGKLCWTFYIGNLLLEYNDGVYRIRNINKINTDYKLYNLLFPIFEEQKNTINLIICEAKKQKHGTTIIFGENENVKMEAERLSKYNRCIMISPLNLIENIKVIINITSIDGALLVGVNGICYAIGAILDGDMEIQGSTERGARYNSAINYIERQKKKDKDFIAIIFSEDETVDIYPN